MEWSKGHISEKGPLKIQCKKMWGEPFRFRFPAFSKGKFPWKTLNQVVSTQFISLRWAIKTENTQLRENNTQKAFNRFSEITAVPRNILIIICCASQRLLGPSWHNIPSKFCYRSCCRNVVGMFTNVMCKKISKTWEIEPYWSKMFTDPCGFC